MNVCPVCGFNKLEEPPANFYICPCCGTEFGNDDLDTSHAELRRRWLQSGARWFSDYTRPPVRWNPYVQLLDAGLAHQIGAQQISGSRITKKSVPGLSLVRAKVKYA